jgi:hypothetical protein
MNQTMRRGMAFLAGGVAVLAGIAAALGVFARGDGTFMRVVSVRGGTYDVATNGVYAFNAQRVVAEGVGWDVFTLLVAVPAMLVVTPLVARGSFRGQLFALGLFGYFLYAYLEYAVTWAFGPLFPLFIVIYGASLAGIVWFATSVAFDGVRDRFGEGFPRRGWAALSIGMSLMLSVMWAGRIFQALTGQADELLLGETTMTVQALDLGLMVPTAVFIAALAWRRSPAGYVMAAAFSVTFIMMSAAITTMLVSAGLVEGTFEAPPILIFGLSTLAAIALSLRMYSVAAPAQIVPQTKRTAIAQPA